ncbi:hypothetical protein CcrC1_gp258c [Caulobacter phage C1]|nr:hypothetical protein CcrC1_gp258c [Caulobacter phage C1]UTU08487.1 hypothetical protein CcrC2_gp259c [Caulobacter phage C2]UTU10120.1 hypothetical protein CcrRB23_gp258c [Caulobacter phage RB23]WGN97155.1 hypothetical protein [Bertelyvirus sp.]
MLPSPKPLITVRGTLKYVTLVAWVGNLLSTKLGRTTQDSAVALLMKIMNNHDARRELRALLDEVDDNYESQ